MSNLEAMDFGDVILAEVPVKVGGKNYTLREADGEASTRWRNAKMNSVKIRDGKVAGAIDMASVDPMLVSRCLFDEDNKLVPIEKLLSWPDRIQKTLYIRLKEISSISEEGEGVDALKEQRTKLDKQIAALEDMAKNSEEDTEAGSD